MFPLYPLASWHDPRACHVFVLALLIFMTLNGVCSAQDPVRPDAVVLEQVHFLLFGRERQEIGEVQLLEEQYRIQLFDVGISTYYTVAIARDDLLSITSISAERTVQVLKERARLIAARAVLREQRRKERRDRAVAVRSNDARSRRGEGLDVPSGSSTPSSSSRVLVPLNQPFSTSSSLEEGMGLLQRLHQVCEELVLRSADLLQVGLECKESLRSWRSASDGNSRLFLNLREESFSLVEQTESISDRIRARMKEIDWTVTQIKDKELRPRDLPELADRIRRRVLQCEKKVDSLDVLLSACRDGLKVLGDPIVKTTEPEGQQAVTVVRGAVTREPSRPAPSSARPETQVFGSERNPDRLSNEAVASKRETLATTNNVLRVSEETSTAGELDSDASSESEEVEQPESASGSMPGGFSTLLIGGLLGALLVLVLTKVVRSLL
ncbi:MAG TPA: hypothetical protein EYO84_05235 [Planctomycetes bacterium]|nr:hypothetical protein [Planctomycetota bacterium]